MKVEIRTLDGQSNEISVTKLESVIVVPFQLAPPSVATVPVLFDLISTDPPIYQQRIDESSEIE